MNNTCTRKMHVVFVFYLNHSGSAIFSEGQTDESHHQFAKNNGKFTQTVSLSPQLLQLAVYREGLQYVIHGGPWGTDLEYCAGSSIYSLLFLYMIIKL